MGYSLSTFSWNLFRSFFTVCVIFGISSVTSLFKFGKCPAYHRIHLTDQVLINGIIKSKSSIRWSMAYFFNRNSVSIFREDVLKKMSPSPPPYTRTKTSSSAEIWRSELVATLFLDFWLSSGTSESVSLIFYWKIHKI